MMVRYSHRLVALALGLLLVGALSACGAGGSASATSAGHASAPTATAQMAPAHVAVGADALLGAASFTQDALTIHAGQAVRFVDPAGTGGPHMLCLGRDQICDPQAHGPGALHNPGFRIVAGAAPVLVVFDTPGVYAITCTFHPLMNMTVTVR